MKRLILPLVVVVLVLGLAGPALARPAPGGDSFGFYYALTSRFGTAEGDLHCERGDSGCSVRAGSSLASTCFRCDKSVDYYSSPEYSSLILSSRSHSPLGKTQCHLIVEQKAGSVPTVVSFDLRLPWCGR